MGALPLIRTTARLDRSGAGREMRLSVNNRRDYRRSVVGEMLPQG